MRKTYILLGLLQIIITTLSAQESQSEYLKKKQAEYNTYKESTQQDFDNYRDQANKEFVAFMKKDWEKFNSFKAIPKPESPDPIQPPKLISPPPITIDKLVPIHNITPLFAPGKKAEPLSLIPNVPPLLKTNHLIFTFYDLPCSLSIDDSIYFSLNTLQNKDLAQVWEHLSNTRFQYFISDILDLRNDLNLCDWAYVQMIDTISENVFSRAESNEAILLQMYILSQSGYDVRLAKDENKLILLLHISDVVYNWNYFEINNRKYYFIGSNSTQMEVLNAGFNNEQPISLLMNQFLKTSEEYSPPKSFSAIEYPEVKLNVSSQINIMFFFDNYPSSDWKTYSTAGLSNRLKETIYPSLMKSISGKSERVAANLLINFVQTAFDYQSDKIQFGYERPMFPDELFFYPFSDCEDRSILFYVLIKDLLKLPVVFVEYPNHLATAVKFSETINGDFLIIENEKYIICDPTYINAEIGNTMPQLRDVSVNIVR